MTENQISFKKKYKGKAQAASVVLFFADFPVLYNGVCNNNMGLMIAGMVIIAVGMILDIIFG